MPPRKRIPKPKSTANLQRRKAKKFKPRTGEVHRLRAAYNNFVAGGVPAGGAVGGVAIRGSRIISAETDSVRGFIWRDNEGKKILIDRMKEEDGETLDLKEIIAQLQLVDVNNDDNADEEANKVIVVLNEINAVDQDEIRRQAEQLAPSLRNRLQLVNVDPEGNVTTIETFKRDDDGANDSGEQKDTGDDDSIGASSSSSEDGGLSWKLFVNVRTEAMQQKYGGDQIKYGKACMAAVQQAIRDLGNNREPLEILATIARVRQQMAVEAGSGAAGNFGKLRDPDKPDNMPHTVVNEESYPGYPQRFIDRARSWGENANKKIYEQRVLTADEVGLGEIEALTQFMLVNLGEIDANSIVHSRNGLVRPLLERVAQLTRELEGKSTQEEQLRVIAEIHWLLANAMPWKRGSAAISHMYAIALMSHLGISVHQRKPNLNIDLEAFLHDKDAFVKAYRSFYQGSENE